MSKRLILFGYEFKNALHSMKRHWFLCLSSITTIFLCFSLVSIFLVIGFHVNSFSQGLARDLSIHVVLSDEIQSAEQIDQARELLGGLDNVALVQFSSKEAELELMIAEKGQAFSSYRGENNPLSNAFFIYLEDQSAIEQTTAEITALDIVESAQYGGSSVSELADMLSIIQNASVIFIVLLSLLSLYLIYSTIKTSIDSRQVEISIQKTVGATAGFIQAPFEIEGVILSVLGAAIPLILIGLVYPWLYNNLGGRLFINAFMLVRPTSLFWWMFFILLLLAVGMGYFASYIAVNRYLKTTR